MSFVFLALVGVVVCFFVQLVINKNEWDKNHVCTLDNVYVRTETRKDAYEVAVKDIVKEKKKGACYTLSFDRLEDGYATTDFAKTFTEDEYKTFIGEGCNRLETDTYVMSLIIPIEYQVVWEVTVWRTAEFGEDKFSDEEIKEIAEAYLIKTKEHKRASFFHEMKLAEMLGVESTKEWVVDNQIASYVKTSDYWSSLEEEGYKRLSDK